MAKLLITGANGQLGSEIRNLAKSDNINSYIFTDIEELDITDLDSVCNYIQAHQPDFIINCAAYTAVDKAEDDVELCTKINHLAVENIAKGAKSIGAKVMHVSTDYVYGGDSSTPYLESDDTEPKSVYGTTKLKGEMVLADIIPENSIIIRTSWLYSTYGKNFVKTMIMLGKERESLNVVSDQRGTPTYARDLANAIIQIAFAEKFIPGTYNYSNEGECTWYDFACEIHKIAGIECVVNQILTKEYPTKAIRPAYSVLDKSKIKRTFGLTIPNWKDSLNECIRILNSNID